MRSISSNNNFYPETITSEDKDKVIDCLINKQVNGNMESVVKYTDVPNFSCSKQQFEAIIDKLIRDGLIRRPNQKGYGDRYILTVDLMDFQRYGGYKMQEQILMKKMDIMMENLRILMNTSTDKSLVERAKTCFDIALSLVKVLSLIGGVKI